ncbi:hypothetical protein KI387_027487, partial [Taxus chinensis]
MAGKRCRFASTNVVSILTVVVLLADIVAAQGPVPAPSSGGCDDTLTNLTPCLDYVMANDTKPPSKDCCSGLKKVVKGNIVCLCSLLGSSNSYGITINQTRAAAMPAACKVKTPPLSACNALVPVSSPLASAITGSSSPGSSPTEGANQASPGSSPSSTT